MTDYISPYTQSKTAKAIRAGVTGQPQSLTAGGTQATGSIVFSANPTTNDTIVLNGVTITFGAAADVDNSVDLDTTGAALQTFLNASVDADLAVATYTYTAGTDTLSISYDTNGVAGNAYTIDTTGLTAAPTSADTVLSGGQDNRNVSLTTENTDIQLSQAVDQDFILPDGKEFQKKVIVLSAKSSTGNAVITPANYTDGTTLTLDADGEMWYGVFLNGAWKTIITTGTEA